MDQEWLKQVIEALKKAINLFYQEDVIKANKMLRVTLPYLERVILEIKNEEIQEEIKVHLIEASNAMELEDNILLADILQYEIVNHLEEFIEN